MVETKKIEENLASDVEGEEVLIHGTEIPATALTSLGFAWYDVTGFGLAQRKKTKIFFQISTKNID